jgi:hypothetical protein
MSRGATQRVGTYFALAALGVFGAATAFAVHGDSPSVIEGHRAAAPGRASTSAVEAFSDGRHQAAVIGRECRARRCSGSPYPPKLGPPLAVHRGHNLLVALRKEARSVDAEIGWVREDYGTFTPLMRARRTDRAGRRWRLSVPKRGIGRARLLEIYVARSHARRQEFWIAVKVPAVPR